MENVTQTIALVTGGSSGIGLATAKKLLNHGINTIILGRKQEKLQQAQSELASYGNIEIIQADLYQTDALTDVIETIDIFPK